MDNALEKDLKSLDQLAYHRREYLEDDLKRYFALTADSPEAAESIRVLYDWILTPITLWPVNIHDLFCVCLDKLEAAESLDGEITFLLSTLPEPPPATLCDAVTRHEHLVQKGHYEDLVHTAEKFDDVDRKTKRNKLLKSQWEEIKSRWAVSTFADAKGLIRRSLSTERNLRPDFSAAWKDPVNRFQVVFDTFCGRWNLYGMLHDIPLVMKLSVNLTPHGTMIFIPAYWSFDAKRDIRWSAVTKLHRTRALKKQGASLSESNEERRQQAIKLRKLDKEGRKRKLKGQKLHAFLCNGLGFVEGTDPKRLTRLRKEFPSESED